jgi:hypothetical protein
MGFFDKKEDPDLSSDILEELAELVGICKRMTRIDALLHSPSKLPTRSILSELASTNVILSTKVITMRLDSMSEKQKRQAVASGVFRHFTDMIREKEVAIEVASKETEELIQRLMEGS